MDFLLEESVFDLEILKSQDLFESSSDICFISMLEACDDDIFMEKSLEEFKAKAMQVFQKILDALKKFFKEIRMQIHIKAQQLQLNKKLTELKDLMAKKRSKAVNKYMNYFDIKKYKEYYTKFINRYTSELIKGMNKDFKSIDEYERWRTDMLNKLADFNYSLSDEEQWKLSVSINSAVKLTDEEAQNRDKSLRMVEEEGSSAIKNLEKYYKTISVEKSFVNYNGTQLKIFSLQNSFIGIVCGKLMESIKKVAKFISKHIFASIALLIALLIAF